MFAKISISPDRIEVADRGAIFAGAILLFVGVGFGTHLASRWRDISFTVASWETFVFTVGFFSLAWGLWWLLRQRLTRCRFDATTRRAEFERRSLRSIERRSIGLDEIADVVVRESAGSRGGLMRGVHVVTRSGERIDVIAVDQTDWNRFPKLADAIREMVGRRRR